MNRSSRTIVRSTQALRALAVAWVVINHAFPDILPGGFIGVDIFFVISGFLISGHLVDRIQNGHFGFGEFYLRRARRLLPAALVVLTATMGMSILWLPAAWLVETFQGIAASAIYGVNWFLALTSVDYFADAGMRIPVNHFWSLSVEEQFYLVWPILIWGVYRFTRLVSLDARWRWISLAAALAALWLLSFWLALSALHRQPQAAYFLTHARAWEFASGGLIAILAPNLVLRKCLPLWIPVLCAWTVLVAAGFLMGPQSQVPGFDALWPVLATAILLLIGDDHGMGRLALLISMAPVQWLGNISYSLYLWHWPLLVILPFALPEGSPYALTVTIGLLLMLPLSVLTYLHVENRYRWNAAGTQRVLRTLSGYVALSIVTAGLAFGLAQYRVDEADRVAETLYRLSLQPDICFGARAREPGAYCPDSEVLADPDYALQSWETQRNPLPGGQICQNALGDDHVQSCAFGADPARSGRHIALLGDSHAGMWAAALGAFATEEGLRIDSYLASSCAATSDPTSFATYLGEPFREACIRWRTAASAAILADPEITLVVVTGNSYNQALWRADGWQEDDGHGFAELWNRFLAAGKKVVVIEDVPMLDRRLPDCLVDQAGGNGHACGRPASEVSRQTVLSLAAELVDQPGLTLLQMRDVFCDEDRCHAVIG